MCPAWLLVAAAVVGVVRGAVSQCWEHPGCQEVNSESSMMECVQLCRSNKMPVFLGDTHLQPPPPSDLLSLFLFPSSPSSSPSSSSSSLPQAKRSYSMEHFRWGKPVGRKRRPVKIYTANGVEEESAEHFHGEMRKRELAGDAVAAEDEEKSAQEEQEQKKDGAYKMKHFRWSGPPASKRYGGFMKSWDERSQRPLLTLFKNVINKDGPEEKVEQ
ncbi:pro-opiomelanocortin-like [Embiotoca jacksoni]|uniref:pro-opiomelanocortin-like n=1 Tax=Embiotoca jacksoni TaxID=100190 RepID=UPI0037042046